MMDNNNQLRQMLEQVRRELENAGEVDEKGRELLTALDRDIHAILGESVPAGESPLTKNLEKTLAHFEVSHPTLTATISQALSVLSNAGI